MASASCSSTKAAWQVVTAGVLHVGALEDLGERGQEARAPHRAHPHHGDPAVGGVGVGGHHHLAARELAVVERGEHLRALVERPTVHLHGVAARAQARHGGDHRQHVAEFAPALEPARPQPVHAGYEPDRQEVDVVQHAARVHQAHHVARAPLALGQRLDGVLGPAIGEVAQAEVARAQRQEAQHRALARLGGQREQPIDHLVARAIAPHRDEARRSGKKAPGPGFLRSLSKGEWSMVSRALTSATGFECS